MFDFFIINEWLIKIIMIIMIICIGYLEFKNHTITNRLTNKIQCEIEYK